ncbi:uncharacterized protein ANIA_10591 [Aspergillus nidulans FGSC A4]|uniref:Uncharacterized protein n=1 Tax=Emericella nidulans (strain FGSC A4 / ATCC 38163 / CBS 112.46 / NRRL 194 / M139) TaxID=227321 RepID=C8VAQ7_EMENI|nr:hypothetical protein [Aspergillus nidulans FGSC A4]CBF76833.1 TPA: conserved hypothetical protein [Aspergillus nidulans FGSC A4]
MPKDSHLLSPMSRALLRAARAGCIYIRQVSKDIDDEEKETTDPEEQQTQQNMERNFSLRKWTTVPKHLEAPEVEFLAKRRPGLPSLYGAAAGTVDGAGSVPMRKTRFKKVDPDTGNILIYAAWVPEGHKIEGEITGDSQVTAESNQVTVTPQAPAPGTVIEGVGVVDAQGVVVAAADSPAVITPQKRRPPPPKRKGKGLKGRRKKVMFAPGEGADAALVHGAGAGDSAANYGKETDSSRMSVDQTTQDEEDEEGDEGEESDDGEGDESGFDAKTPETPGPQPSTEPELTPISASAKTGTTADSHAPQVSQASEPDTEPSQASAQQAASLQPSGHVPVAPISMTDSSRLDQDTQVTSTERLSEDVHMADATTAETTLRASPKPSLETQLQPAPGVAQPLSPEKAPSAQQQTSQAPVLEASGIGVENAQPPATEQTDVTMEEARESVPEPSEAMPENTNLQTVAPESSLPGQASANESTPPEADQQPSGSEFNLLDNLEASLNNPRQETLSDVQKGAISEQKTGVLPSQETITAPGEAASGPTETSTEAETTRSAETKELSREDPVAPPVEQLTPPGADQITPLETSEQKPQQAPPTIEQYQPEKLAGTPTHPEPGPATPAFNVAPEGQAERPPVLVPVPAEATTSAEAIAKPQSPTVEGHSPQHSTEPAVEKKQEQQTSTTPSPTEPATTSAAEQPQPQATAQHTPKELSRPQTETSPASNVEPGEGSQGEATQAQMNGEHGTSGDGPSPNGERQTE